MFRKRISTKGFKLTKFILVDKADPYWNRYCFIMFEDLSRSFIVHKDDDKYVYIIKNDEKFYLRKSGTLEKFKYEEV